ncbi:hypothetical protein [Aliidiomarina haloalkalitolerans]|uniref:Uncharacterized protein n=1 Tax=Aliidiomarina haloalkalitolerans TaxID=859059 RepID=A0A432VZ32_9GAMM|nr:hypothetical protein [Aliidiomarina haloalkalitolerans]RUO21908.1 hypothetical protein CWE06_03435 [Aliidiomarina haloalkalitolerans]
MNLRKSKLAFLIGISPALGSLFFAIHVMDVGGFLIIPTSTETLVSVEKIYYACVVFILCIGYLLLQYVIKYVSSPRDLIIDFENRIIKNVHGEELSKQFIKVKIVSFSKGAQRYLMDFHDLEKRIYRIQMMYKSDLSVREVLDKHTKDGALHVNPFSYFNKSLSKG